MPDLQERLKLALADRYAVESEIGRGGMATVFLAEDFRHRRKVAIKVLHPELATAVGTERFLNEVEIVAGLTHPNILTLIDSGEVDGLLYYVMPYVDGESLHDRLEREQQLPIEDALQIAREVAEALGYAHGHGVVHRDIKPGNVLLEQGHAVITDFGVAKAVGEAGRERLTATGMAVGTPAYMSPEQGTAGHTPDVRTDIYALGCVLYEMLAGDPPFTGATPQVVMKRHSLDAVPSVRTARDTVPESAEYAIEKALAKVPADRFSTTREFILALEAPPPDVRNRKRRVAGLVSAAVVVVSGVAIGVATDLFSGSSEAAPVTVVLGTPELEDVDPGLGPVVLTYLEGALLSSPRVHAAKLPAVQQALVAMGRQLDADLDEATALEVAQRTGAAGAVLPSLTRVGSGMLLSASVVASDGAMLAIVRRPVANDDALTGALDTLSLDLRKELGESRRSLRESPSLLYLLTPSLEAARLFSEARQITVTEPTLAASLLEQAISIDPEFAWAYDYLSTLRQNTGGEYLSPLERELELADRLLPHQRRLAEIQGLSVRKGDYQAAIEVAREGLQASTPMMLANPDYPHTYYTYLVLSYMEVGDPAQAREIYSELTEKVAAGEAEEWELEFLTRIINSAMLAAQMGDSTRADLYMAQWNERVPEIYRWLGESWTAIAGKQWSRAAAAARRVTTADASPEHRMQGALLLGSIEAVRGRPRSSREAFALAGGIAQERGDPFYALSVEIQEADAEFFALADPQRASARLVDFLGEPPPENGLARRYHARAQAVAFAMCAYFVEPPVEGPASRLNCRADVVTDSLRDPIETLEALGWKAVVEGRYGDAVRIGSEPLLRRAGGAGSRGRAPAAFAYEALGTPDSAAAIFRDMARAPFGYISSAPSAIVMRSYALRQLARLPGAAGDSALAVLRAEWAEAEPEFLGRVADSPP